MDEVHGSAALQAQAEQVANGEVDPYTAADAWWTPSPASAGTPAGQPASAEATSR
jgi:hypothetical protein